MSTVPRGRTRFRTYFYAAVKRPSRRVWCVAAAVTGLFFCPIVTRVSDEVVIRLVDDKGESFVGVTVRESWGVYGWGGFGGIDTRVTNDSGEATFPSRYVLGFLGPRAVRRGQAFLTQCASVFIFGYFGSQFTERWGPIVRFDLNLPPGMWLPAVLDTTEDAARNVLLPIMGDGPHRYIYLRNIDPDRPTAAIGGDQQGLLHGTTVLLRVRKASDEEGRNPTPSQSTRASPYTPK